MAIDTALKRASIAAIGAAFIGPSVIPDAAIDQADRQTIAYSYSGILAAAPAASGDHVRTQIRQAAVSRLTGLTTTGANVFASRTGPLDSRVPALCIYTDSEVSEYEDSSGHLGCAPGRTVDLTVEGYHNGGSDDVLDTIALEVETAIFSDGTWGGLAKYTGLSSTEIARDGTGETEAGVIRMVFSVLYRVVEGTPNVPV